jgi:hypothetical protein
VAEAEREPRVARRPVRCRHGDVVREVPASIQAGDSAA